MKNRYIKRCFAILVIVLLLGMFPMTSVLANSAQTQWAGVSPAGVVIKDKESPIIVEKELLTFDITEFPEQHYTDADKYLAYSGKVTAEYTFFNPADYTVTATLAFPFGNIPDYGHIYNIETDERIWGADTEKYDVTIDGQPIKKTLRHTYLPAYTEFEPERDLARLNTTGDAFYSPDMTVTKYNFVPKGVDTDTYDAATAAFEYSGDPGKTKIFLNNARGGGGAADGKSVSLHAWVDNDAEYTIYAIGQPLDEIPVWKVYENGGCEKEIDGEMEYVGTETITFQDFALTAYEPDSGISEEDWYNAIVASMNMHEWTPYGALTDSEFGFDVSGDLMRWYEYEITLEPGERVMNAVAAPVYPSIDSSYEPPVYEYTYLLSPAKTWAEFGNLDIVIKTSFYMLENEDYEKTGEGYTLSLTGLPEGELSFKLSADENPSRPSRVASYFPTEIMLVGAAVLVAIVVVILFVRVAKKKRMK